MPPPLEIVGVRKRFRDQVALDGVDLVIREGESVALVGPNGAGKTTLLRTIVDLVRPDAGEVRVAGSPVARDRAAVSRVGWALGDERGWYWRLSGRVNLEVFGRMRGLARDDAARSAAALLEELGLAGPAERPVAEYSTGMRARLALARARLGEPRLIILDEVARGLDAAGREDFLAWLASPGRPAVLVVTHSPEQAAAADRLVRLQAGRPVKEPAS